MPSSFYHIDPQAPDPAPLGAAVDVLRRGGLVVFPTETVYGLGADGLNPAAVRHLRTVKRRPPDRPLPLLIGDGAEVEKWAAEVPSVALALMAAFWPGPLTLIFRRNERIPPEVVAGGPNVGLRCPDHPIAQALLQQVGRPLAAPSANRSGHPPPTTAAAAQAQLLDEVDLYLEAGPSALGMASTVLDLTVAPPRFLRLGSITREDLEQVLGAGSMEGA